MTTFPPRRPGALSVRFGGRVVAILHPGCPPFTFGRGSDCSLTIGEADPDGRHHISRHAGSIQWADGRWLVCNDSDSRPFDVGVGGVANPVAPRTSQDARWMWAVGPHPVKVQIPDPPRLYILELLPERPRPCHPRPKPLPADGSTSPPGPQEPSQHARLILAAKFLALPEPGDSVPDAEAAEYATAARGPHGEPVGEDAVRNVVYRWKKELERRGAQGLHDSNTLGRQLLAWGVISQVDRRLLRPWRAVRPAESADLPVIRAVLSEALVNDPVLGRLIPDPVRRGRILPPLVALIAETVLPFGASLFAVDGGAALWTPPGALPQLKEPLLWHAEKLAGPASRIRAALMALTQNRLSASSYHLCVMGVIPAQQRKRIGSDLLAAALDRYDREQVPAYVDVPTGRVHEFYGRHSFADVSRVDLPGGLTLHCMRRDPMAPRTSVDA